METHTGDNKVEHKNLLEIEVKEAPYGELSKFADRVATLLKSEKAESSPNMVASLDDLLGAVYALIFANYYGFENRLNRPIEVSAILTRAEQVAKGQVRTDGKWMAGFYFNSALFRESAVYHRVLKIVVGKSGNVDELGREAGELYRLWRATDWRNRNVHAVHGQVTELKHERKGIYEGRRKDAGFQNAVLGVGELLDLIEAWTAKG